MIPARPAALLLAALLAGACASGPVPLPGPDDPRAEPANAPGVLERLDAERRAAEASPTRASLDAARRASYLRERREAAPLRDRPTPPEAFARLPGERDPVERTVVVRFDFGSARFAPNPADAYRLRTLLASADRAIVRGRTDALGDTEANARMARRRAESARLWLVERGLPDELIAVTAYGSGDYVAANESGTGRDRNRRVEVEFVFDDPLAVEVAGQ